MNKRIGILFTILLLQGISIVYMNSKNDNKKVVAEEKIVLNKLSISEIKEKFEKINGFKVLDITKMGEQYNIRVKIESKDCITPSVLEEIKFMELGEYRIEKNKKTMAIEFSLLI